MTCTYQFRFWDYLDFELHCRKQFATKGTLYYQHHHPSSADNNRYDPTFVASLIFYRKITLKHARMRWACEVWFINHWRMVGTGSQRMLQHIIPTHSASSAPWVSRWLPCHAAGQGRWACHAGVQAWRGRVPWRSLRWNASHHSQCCMIHAGDIPEAACLVCTRPTSHGDSCRRHCLADFGVEYIAEHIAVKSRAEPNHVFAGKTSAQDPIPKLSKWEMSAAGWQHLAVC